MDGLLERDPQIDTIILGCTHYPFVKDMIHKGLGHEVKLFDGGEGTARETRRQLEARELINPSTERGRVIFENSAGRQELLELSERLLNYEGKLCKS